MKKKIIVLLTVATLGTMAGCGNMSLGIGNFTFDKIHVDTHNFTGCFEVKKWHDNSSGIEVKTKEAGSMFLPEGTYVLIEGDCPFCEVNPKGE